MIQILLIALISLLAQTVLPWWSLAIVAFGVCFWRSPGGGKAFLFGFVGVALVWLLYALVIHIRTDGIFTGRMSLLLFQVANSVVPLLITALIGGLVGGVAGWAGFSVRQAAGSQPTNRTAGQARS